MTFTQLFVDEIAEFLTKTRGTEWKQEYAKHIALWMLSTFWGISAKNSVYILKLRKIGQSLEDTCSMRGGKLAKNLKTFWMNN